MSPTPKDIAQIPDDTPVDSAPSDPEQPDLHLPLRERQQEWRRHKGNEAHTTHDFRLKYAGRIYCMVVAWLECVVVAVGLSGWKIGGFELSDTVLVAFITSTTVNVIGLFVVFARWKFPAST